MIVPPIVLNHNIFLLIRLYNRIKIDMHFRFLISKMYLDIEHDLKVPVLPLLRVICYINILLLHVRHISIESQPLMIVLSGYC